MGPSARHRNRWVGCAGSDTSRAQQTAGDARQQTRISLCILGEIRGGLPKKHILQQLWARAGSPEIGRVVAGLPRPDHDADHHRLQHLDRGRPFRTATRCRTGRQSCVPSQSQLSACQYGWPSAGIMRREQCRFFRSWLPPIATVPPLGWRVVGPGTKALCYRRSCCGRKAEQVLTDPEPLRHLRNRLASLGDLRDSIALKLISEIARPHQGLLASNLGKKASTNLRAIQRPAAGWRAAHLLRKRREAFQ